LDKVYLGQNVSELNFGQQPANITRVTLQTGSGQTYTAGDDTGRVIEKECRFASQAMAESVLNLLKNAEYQPYSVTGALLDPAAEIGDSIIVGGVYSVLAQSSIEFDRMCAADISAPTSDDLNDEYPYESPEKRKLDRVCNKVGEMESAVEEIKAAMDNFDAGQYVISFNGRTGEVVPQVGDYTDEINEAIRKAIYESWEAAY